MRRSGVRSKVISGVLVHVKGAIAMEVYDHTDL